jgi:PAS domain-containing protein
MATNNRRSIASPAIVEDHCEELALPGLPEGDWLFTSAAEPMLIVQAETGTIVEANPPAADLFRETCARMLGTVLSSAFEPASAATVEACVAIAQVVGSAETLCVRPRSGGVELSARLSLFRAPTGSFLLVRLGSTQSPAANDQRPGTGSVVFQAIDTAQVGFLLTDRGFCVDYANREFLDMIDLDSQHDICGGSLLRWLSLSDTDLRQLRTQLSQRQAVTRLTTHLTSRRGDPRRVEVCAVAVPAGSDTCWGFSICEQPRLN